MATLRLFASVREAAGVRSVEIDGETVGVVIEKAIAEYGDHFGAMVPTCRTWVNGEPADESTEVGASDEVALLPPVSGGSD